MAMIFTSSVAPRTPHCTLLPSSSSSSSSPPTFLQVPTTHYRHSFALASQNTRNVIGQKCLMVKEDKEVEFSETILHSFSPLPLLYAAALLPGAGAVTSAFEPFVDVVKSFDLPGWLVHWGHPGNMIQQKIIMILITIKNMVILLLHLKAFNMHPRMTLGCNASYAIEHHSRRFKKAVVLFAMGGYGTYLGFRIRYSDDVEEKAKAKDLHPKLLAGMFFFFALGATGGVTSLLTSDKPIFESPHAVTGVIGLALLTIQTILPSLFEGNPGLRNVHGILGSSIMTLFLIHAALGLQLGLSS